MNFPDQSGTIVMCYMMKMLDLQNGRKALTKNTSRYLDSQKRRICYNMEREGMECEVADCEF